MSMSLVSLVAEGAAEGGEHLRELPMPAYMYGVIALIGFALLLAVTWAFRGTAARFGDAHHPGEGEHSGTASHQAGHH